MLNLIRPLRYGGRLFKFVHILWSCYCSSCSVLRTLATNTSNAENLTSRVMLPWLFYLHLENVMVYWLNYRKNVQRLQISAIFASFLWGNLKPGETVSLFHLISWFSCPLVAKEGRQNFCLQKSRMPLAGLVYLISIFLLDYNESWVELRSR